MYKKLEKLKKKLGLSWEAIAEEIGVSNANLFLLKKNGRLGEGSTKLIQKYLDGHTGVVNKPIVGIKILSGIPIPDPKFAQSAWVKAFDSMKIKDSFEIEEKRLHGALTAIRNSCKKTGSKFTTCYRRLGAGKCMVWKVKLNAE